MSDVRVDVRVYTVAYPSGLEFQQTIPVELEGRSEVLRNTLAASDGEIPLLVLPGAHVGNALDAWAQVALPEGVLDSHVYPAEFLLKALTVRVLGIPRARSC